MKKLFVIYLLILAFRQDVAAQKIDFSEFFYTNSGNNYTFYITSSFRIGYGSGGPRVKFTYINKTNDTVFIKALYDPTGIVWPFAGSVTEDTVHFINTYSDLNYFYVSTSCVKEYIDAGGMHVKDTVWNQFDTTFYIGTASIKEQNALKALAIYPNPTSTAISLPIAANDLLVYNSYGQVVLQAKEIVAQQPILVSQLNSGLYFVAVFDKEKNKIGVGKFYKE